MLKKYKNQLLDIIESRGHDPTAFIGHETNDMQSGARFNIQYEGTGLKFVVTESSSSSHRFTCQYTRFHPAYPKEKWQYYPTYVAIDVIVPRLVEWLDEHVKELNDEMSLPDQWEQIRSEPWVLEVGEITGEELHRFTEEEARQIRESIIDFRSTVIKEFHPLPEQLQLIDSRLKYLSDGVSRLNRTDWKALALSTVIGMSINLSLDTERGKFLFSLFKAALSQAMRLLQ